MLKKIAFGLVILSGLLLISCDPDDVNGTGNESSKNYWERSAWNHLKLKGKVKSIKSTYEDSDTYYETIFGEHGEILKMVSRYQEEEPRVINFEYNSSGQLIKDDYGTYEYGTHGKYVPRETFHINEAGLVKNLVKFNDDYPIFKFEGGDLLVIWEGDYTDTIVVKYTGNYPTKINDVTTPNVEWGSFMNASYQTNGMFDVFEEGWFSTGENPYVDSRKYYYKKDNEFMLLDKTVMSNISPNPDHNFSYETKYIYNDKKDLVRIDEYDVDGSLDEEATMYYEYEYDEKGNWTKETFKFPRNDIISITNREIKYFD